MSYWLTIHWPSSKEEEEYPAVWVRPGQIHAVDAMREGDLVAVYETLRNPESHRRVGEGRIIGYGSVVERIHDGDGPRWVLVARLGTLRDEGRVSWQEASTILGYPLRRGLQEICEENFNHLARQLVNRV